MSESNPYRAPATPADQSASVPLAGLAITTTMLGYLKATRSWVRFFSVLAFIGLGFLSLAALSLLVVGVVSPSLAGGSLPLGLAGMGVSYLVLGAVYVLPTLALHRFAGALTRLLADGTEGALEESFRNQHSFWKVSGILTIIVMCLAVLAIPIAVVVAAAGILSR